MRRKSIIILAYFTLFVTCLAFALEGNIVEIRIKGNKRVDTETIKSYLTSKVGERYYPMKVRQDVKNIYARGFFSDVRVEGEQTTEGVILTYSVEEKPLVKSVKFTGNSKGRKEDIQGAITLKEHQVLNMTDVRETEKAISAYYQKQGFFLAEIKTEIEPTEDGQVRITFKIDEKDRVMVKRVIFLGNEAFGDSDLLSHISTRPAGALSFLTQQGKFRKEEFDLDVARLTYFYYDNGYIRVQIAPPQVFVSPDKSFITVVYRITEGPQFFVGKMDIQGDMIRPKAELMSKLTLEEKDVYSSGRLRRDMDNMADFYADYGYADANVVPETMVHEAERTVDIIFHISKGIKVYIERIDITGNNKTRDMVIRRQLKIKEGQLYSATAIRKSEQAIMRLGFFKQAKILSRQGSRPDLRRLTVTVEETSTGTLSAGAGYSSTENFIFTGQISLQNLQGRGQSLALSLFWGKETQNFNISFSDPYFMDSRWSLNLNTYIYIRDFIDFNRRDAGGSVGVGHLLPRSDFSRFFVTYMYEDTKLTNLPSFNSILDRIPLDTTTSSLTFAFDRNSTNNFLDPTAGSEFYGSIEVAGGFLGADNDFTKYTLKAFHYQPVFKGTYIGAKGILGVLAQSQGNRLLLTERYFLGGISDLRGYNLRTIGPAYPSEDPSISPIIIGGNKELVLSLDYIIPIAKQVGIKAVLFADAGNAFNDFEPIDLGNLRYDWGFGIRWLSPLGPLRFELGFPINKKPGEESHVFQFAVGSPLR